MCLNLSHRSKAVLTMLKCAKCDSPISAGKLYVEDDHANLTFCDDQCWREWAVDAGEAVVLDFYRQMNVGKVLI